MKHDFARVIYFSFLISSFAADFRRKVDITPTLQQVESQQQEENGSGGDLDPPSIKEREEDDSDNALPGQRRPRAFWFGLGEC